MSDIAYIGRLMSRKDGEALVVDNSLSHLLFVILLSPIYEMNDIKSKL